MPGIYFCRAGRAGRTDVLLRTPELEPLRNKTVAVFGAGCLGAPSALEFARAGVGRLRLLDHDFVDPATIARWPFGLAAAGLPKVAVLKSFIEQNYPSTDVHAFTHTVGGVEFQRHKGIPSDHEVIQKMTEDASLIYDATAELGVQQFLADHARELGVPYVGVAGTNGAWGGKVFRIVPGATAGCWMCYRHAYAAGQIPVPATRPDDDVQPLGCGDPTFTGAGFDMTQVALHGVRQAVSVLSEGEKGYPSSNWDVTVIDFRDGDGNLIPPQYRGFSIDQHPECPKCSGQPRSKASG